MLPKDQLWHSIWIVHSIERNWRSQRRMRTYERDESEKRGANHLTLRSPLSRDQPSTIRLRVRLEAGCAGKVVHLAALAHRLLQEVELWVLPCQP